MERESNPMQPMCRSGCGFYGNPATDGLCSVCYKDSLRKKQTPPLNTSSSSVSSQQQSTQAFSPPVTVTETAQPTIQSLQNIDSKDNSTTSAEIPMKTSTNALFKSSTSTATNNPTTSTNAISNAEIVSGNNINNNNNDNDGILFSDIVTIIQNNSSIPTPSYTTINHKFVENNSIKEIVIDDDVMIKQAPPPPPPPSSIKINNKRKFPSEDSPNTSSNISTSDVTSEGPSTSVMSGDDQDKDGDKDNKKKKNRCQECRKKVGLTGFECRCGGLFCALHRYSDKHKCSFDYREHGAQEIRRNNPVVVGEKIQKI